MSPPHENTAACGQIPSSVRRLQLAAAPESQSQQHVTLLDDSIMTLIYFDPDLTCEGLCFVGHHYGV